MRYPPKEALHRKFQNSLHHCRFPYDGRLPIAMRGENRKSDAYD